MFVLQDIIVIISQLLVNVLKDGLSIVRVVLFWKHASFDMKSEVNCKNTSFTFKKHDCIYFSN